MPVQCVVAHVTTVHRWDDVRIFTKQCRSLAAAGFDVRLLAPGPPGERTVDQIRIIGLGTAAARWKRAVFLTARALGWIFRNRPDIVHMHDPELMTLVPIIRCLRIRVILDVHEDLAKQILSKPWIHARARKPISLIMRLLEKGISRISSSTVAATPSIAANFHAATIIQNFPRLEELDQATGISVPYDQRPPLAAYVGAITEIRGIVELVTALGLLSETDPLRLALIGEFAPRNLEAQVRALKGWSRVDFLGWQDRSSVIGTLGRSRMGVVNFHGVPNHLESQPNKIFEYLAAGLPIIYSRFEHWEALIGTEQCGIPVDPTDPEQIAKAMTWLANNPVEAQAMGERGRAAVIARWSWRSEERKLIDLYGSLGVLRAPGL